MGGQANDTETVSAPTGGDPFALLRASHPLFQNVCKANLPQFMTFGTNWMRQREIDRPDAIIEDPLLAPLCKELGEAVFRCFPDFGQGPDVVSYITLRAFCIDHAVRNHDPAIRQVVMVGGALDTRAFRIDEFHNCTVFELHTDADIMAYKEKVLQEQGAVLKAKKRTAILTRLTDDSWQADLLAAGFDPRKPVLWIMESTLHFLKPEQMMPLISGIDFMSVPHSQLITERVLGGGLDLEMDKDAQVSLLIQFSLRYGEDGGVFRELPWNVDLLMRRNQALEYYGTLWDPVRFDRFRVTDPAVAVGGAWFIPLFSKLE